MSDSIGIAMIGCGDVGSAVARILIEDSQALQQRTGFSLDLRHIVVRNPDKLRPYPVPPERLTTDAAAAIHDDAVQIVVELIGGADVAGSLIQDALRAGKNVVTANKALLALRGREIFAAAREVGRCVAFEAAVGGGIPIVESVRRGLIANDIDAIVGILNGASNYILTRMFERGMTYREALLEAQKLGYAETDPTLDVNGVDAAHKLAILASIAMRTQCDFDRIVTRGITDLEVTDLLAGEELGYVCKLLAIARRSDNGLDLSAQPTFIRRSHPLAGVCGPYNAVSVYGHAAGHALFYGPGAGGMPTASAVVSDIVDVAVGNAQRVFSQYVVLPDQTPESAYHAPGEARSPFYIRVNLVDKPGGVGKIATVLGDAQISIASVVQHDPHVAHPEGAVPVVVMTRAATDRSVQASVEKIAKIEAVVGRVVCIPALDERVSPCELG